MKKLTLKDIAIEAGVSVMTVSRVLNNNKNVHPQTREKIEEILRKRNFVPDPSARVLKGGKTSRIGIVVSDIKNPFYSEMIGTLEDIAGKKQISVVFADTNMRTEGEVEAINSLVKTSVDSVLFAPEGFNTEHIDNLLSIGQHFVILGVHFPDKKYPEVWIDDEAGAYMIGDHFRKKGAEKPLLLMGNPHKNTTINRIKGFKNGFTEMSKEFIEYLPVDWKCCEDYLTNNKNLNSYDCIFCYNDLIAMGAVSALRKKNIIPGKDILVAGFDDISYAELFGLTTVKIPVQDMLETAIDMVVDSKYQKIKFVPNLVIRDSA